MGATRFEDDGDCLDFWIAWDDLSGPLAWLDGGSIEILPRDPSLPSYEVRVTLSLRRSARILAQVLVLVPLIFLWDAGGWDAAAAMNGVLISAAIFLLVMGAGYFAIPPQVLRRLAPVLHPGLHATR